MNNLDGNVPDYRIGSKMWDSLESSPRSKSTTGKDELTGNTPPTTPKRLSSSAVKTSKKKIPTNIAPKNEPEGISKRATPIDLKDPVIPKDTAQNISVDAAQKQDAPLSAVKMKDTAKNVSKVAPGIFRKIADFFSKIGEFFKYLFVARPISNEVRAKRHLAELAVHLADVKAMDGIPSVVKGVVKPIINRLLLNDDVLPNAIEKAKDLLQNKLFGPGKARPIIEELEKNIVQKLGDDLATITNCYQPGSTLAETEANTIQAMADKKNEDMSTEEVDAFSKRYPTIDAFAQKKKEQHDNLLEIKSLNDQLVLTTLRADFRAELEQKKGAFEKKNLQLKKDMALESNKLLTLLSALENKEKDVNTPLYEKQQLRKDIQILNSLFDKNSYPKTHVGVLHQALYAPTVAELEILSERYDIIRAYYPNVKVLEDLEIDLKKATSVLDDRKAKLNNAQSVYDKRILVIENMKAKTKDSAALKKWEDKLVQEQNNITQLTQDVNQAEDDISRLTQDVIKARVEVNRNNYATAAVLDKLIQITPRDANHKLNLDSHIAALRKIVEIEKKIAVQEQKYIREISEKIFDLVYPDGLPTKFTLPVRIFNLVTWSKMDPKEQILQLVDVMLFNAIDNASHPGMIYSLINELLINLKAPASVVASATPAASLAPVANPKIQGLDRLAFEIAKIGFPKLTTAGLWGAIPAAKLARAVGEYINPQPATQIVQPASAPEQEQGWLAWGYQKLSNAASYASWGVSETANIEKTIAKVAQEKINQGNEFIIKQLESSSDTLMNEGWNFIDEIMFPNEKIRAFKPGLSNGQMAQLKDELNQNLGEIIKEQTKDMQGHNYISGFVQGGAALVVDRLNMQIANKHLIYGAIDQVLAVLKV